MTARKQCASLFELDGAPKMSQAIPLALQHVVAMIVGCVTPAIIISGAAGIDTADRVLLIQASLVVSALSTLLQLFPIGRKNGFHLGSALPVILGVSFAYVPSMQAIAETSGIAAILGAQIAGGICAVVVGLSIKKIRRFFPPLIAGTVVFTIGLSLYPTAINYMAGGTGQPGYGSWQNWTVAIFTLVVVTALNHFAKGFLKLASILIGMIAGYIFSSFFGMVSFTNVAEAGVFQLPQIMHFGITFEPSACVAIGLLFVINSVQAIGDFSATTAGGLDREPTTGELHGAILGYGVSNIFGAFLGCLPTATYRPERRNRSYHKGGKPRDPGTFRPDHPDRRTVPQVFCTPYHHSLCGSWRSYRICICLHCHDRHETCHDRKHELPQHLYRWACGRFGNGCITGLRFTGRFPRLGDYYFRQVSRCNRYLSCCFLKCNPSQG